MKKYKVAFLGLKGIPAKHGADRVGEALAEQLTSRFDVTVYCKKGYNDAPMNGYLVHRVIIPTIRIKNIDMLVYLILSALHARFIGHYDVIHLHNIDCAFITPFLSRSCRKRIIATSHGSPYIREKWSSRTKRFFRFMEKIFINYSDIRTSVAQPLKKYYEQTYKKKVHYIPNGCNTIEKASTQMADELIKTHRINGDYLLFAAGRILPSKGCHVLLDAYRSLNILNQLVIVGDLDQMPDYSAELIKNTHERVKFVGLIEDKEQLMGIVKRAKLFIFPSSYEAASMMLLEAVTMHVPVIASDIPENKSMCRSSPAISRKIRASWIIPTPFFLKPMTRMISPIN